MIITETAVADAFRLVPEQLHDARGTFFEAWRQEPLSRALGRPFPVRQVNYAVSRRNTLRGFHFAVTPPGQAKLITCVQGAALAAVLDLRVGSPTFGRHELIAQDQASGVGVYAAEGIGVAFQALTDGARVNYLCSTEFVTSTMIGIDALDPALGIAWDLREPPVRSIKDSEAPTLEAAAAAGVLPEYERCVAFYHEDARRTQALVG